MQEEEIINYPTFDGALIKSFLTGDRKSKSAIIVIQEIWGLTNFIKGYSRKLSSLGFLVMAPHLYSRKEENNLFSEENIAMAMRSFYEIPTDKRGDQKTIKKALEKVDPNQREVIQRLMMGRGMLEERMVKDLALGYEFLKDNFGPTKFGVVGFCMGGGLSFRISTQLPFDATVVYYGANPPDLGDIAKMKGPMLGFYAGDDPRINAGLPDLITNFLKFKKQLELNIYPNVSHAFANNDGFAYNRGAAEDAWEKASSFFTRYLK
jgi:carboxymethylenebutenolidase